MYFATNPSNLPTTSATARWYAPMMSRRSSGSRRVASGVDPTRSQNIMVSCRRSASAPVLPSPACGGAPGMAALGRHSGGRKRAATGGRGRWNWIRRRVGSAELRNGFEQLAPVAYRRHADVLEIIGRQLRQHRPIDFVVPEI